MKRLIVIAAAAAACTAHAQQNPRACAWQECGVGDVVVTTPSAASGPNCTQQGITLYVAYVMHPGLPPGEQRERVETELRLRSGARSYADAMQHCQPTPAGKRVKVVAVGAAKTGLLQVDPQDGGQPYWLSTFDVSKP